MEVSIRLLGPVRAWDGQRAIALGPRKQRLVFAVLALEAGRAVDVARLVDLAWPEEPPRTAQHAIQVCVSGLRSALRGADGLDVRLAGSGYLLAADRSLIDAHRFRALLASAREAAGDTARVALLDEALALWSGAALAGTATPAVAERLCAGLEEARLGAAEDRLDALLRLGRHREALDELPGLVAAHPLRERLAGQLMTGLYRDGRAAEALDGCRRYRERLAEDLGLDPGSALRDLELAILRNEEPPEPGGARPAAAVSLPPPPPAPAPAAARDTGPPVPAQLPSAAAGFAGRDGELAELDTLLAGRRPSSEGPASPAVVITGSAGVGKTALAVHWAHRRRGDFPDGQLYVNLAGYAPAPPLPPERALAGFLRALGVPAERIPPEVDEAAALYRSLLADRRLLVVLDNARSPDQVRPLLPGGAGCLTVITSRDRLAGLAALEGARPLPLGVLGPGEALAVLAAVLGADRVGADPAAAADVAALCACLPLALRIAAAHLARHARQPLGGLAAELREGNRLSVLSVAGDEQSAVRGSFDLSYAALRPAARRTFLLAGLSPGGDLSERAVAALAAVPVVNARAVLADLTEAHLMDEDVPGRFGMHDLLRLYAGDRARAEVDPGEREAATGRLCDFYLRATAAAARLLYPNMQRLPMPARLADPDGDGDAGVAFDGHADALDWLEAERANLVTIVTWAAGHGHREAAWLIADAMRGYFWTRRYAADWLAVAEAGLAAAVGRDPQAMAAAHISLAQAKRWLTRYGAAAGHLEQAAALASRSGWQQGAAAAYGSLANVYRDQGRMAESADNHRRALAIYRATGGRGGEATSLVNLGNVLLETGNAADAVAHLTQALAIHREIGARAAEGNVLNSLGCAHLIRGATEEARRYLDAALAVHRETGSLEGEADDLSNMAELHIDTGQLDRARELAMASLTLARESGERRVEIDASNALGTAARQAGDLVTAFRHHQEALKFAAEAGYRQGEAVALTGLAQDQAGLGDYDAAVTTAQRAIDVARRTRLRLLEGHALVALASISLDRGRRADARAHAAAALAVHREAGHVPGQSRAERLLELLAEA